MLDSFSERLSNARKFVCRHHPCKISSRSAVTVCYFRTREYRIWSPASWLGQRIRRFLGRCSNAYRTAQRVVYWICSTYASRFLPSQREERISKLDVLEDSDLHCQRPSTATDSITWHCVTWTYQFVC